MKRVGISTLTRMLAFCVVVVIHAADSLASVPAEGGDLMRIVIADSEDPVQKHCSEDLQRIFEVITGETIEIATEPAQGRCLYIGAAPEGVDVSVQLAELNEQGIYLAVTQDHIICTGTTPEGVYNAVQELLYQIDYRMVWPGVFGECFPKESSLKLGEDLDIVHNPSFALRGGLCVQVEAHPGKSHQDFDVGLWTDWAARNHVNRFKAGYCETWDYGASHAHGWQEIQGHSIQDIFLRSQDFGTKNPKEWYALFQGKRQSIHPVGTTPQPCVSNPEFIAYVTETILNYFRENPHAHRYMIGASDEESYWCECPNCKALDPVQYHWRHNDDRQIRTPDFTMTDRWMYFVNRVADEVKKEFPDKWIATFAYSGTKEPPIRYMPADNVMIELTVGVGRKHRLDDSTCPYNQNVMRLLNAWGEISPAMSIYSYLEHKYMGVPIPFFDSAADLYRTVHNHGVRHISDEIDSTPHASPVYMGLWGRLMWDLDTDHNQYITDFCRITYGAASTDMEKFWRYQQDVMINSEVPHRQEQDIERYTPEVIKKSMKFLDQASSREITEDEAARIERARMSVWMAKFYHDRNRADTGGELDAWVDANDSRIKVFQTAKDYGYAINLFAWRALGGGERFGAEPKTEDNAYRLPIEALGGKTIVELPEQWMCRLDPNEEGVDQGWYAADNALQEFQAISTHDFWENQWPGSYDGYAWYVVDTVIPETPGHRVWLLFGAVDETWKLWIDGEKVGACTGKPAEVWDKPAAFDITDQYTPGKKIRIAVQVHDSGNMGGIWKPVTVVTTNGSQKHVQ